MTQTNYDADDVLMGGGNAPAWKFDDPGTTRVGTILSKSTRQEREYDRDNPGGGALKFFPSGDPIMGIVIEVRGEERNGPDDDGKRTFYVEGKYLKEAVRDGVRRAGASKLELGAQLSVTFTHREDPMDKRSRKYWNVVYTPAADAALVTEQGPVNAATGEIAPTQQPLAQGSSFGGGDRGLNAQPVAAQPPVVQAPAVVDPNQPTPEQLAAVRANGVDPRVIFPAWNGVG